MPLLSNVFGFTHSVVSHVGHAVLRDLTCYYTYHEDVQRLADATANQFPRGDVAWSDKSIESFCLSPNIEDDLDGVQSDEDNSTVHIVEDNVNCLGSRDKKSDESTSTGTVKIQNTEEISCIGIRTNNLGSDMIEINQPRFSNGTLHLNVNVTEKETYSNICDDVENRPKIIASAQTLNVDSVSENKKNPHSDDRVYEISEPQDVLNDNDIRIDNYLMDEHTTVGNLIQINEVDENNIAIGTINEESSDTSSGCELGICSFKTSNFRNKFSDSQNSERPKQKKKLFEDKIINNKISRYITNTMLLHTARNKPNLVEETSNLESQSTTVDCLKDTAAADEVSCSLLNMCESQEPELVSNSLPREIGEITDNPIKTCRMSEDVNDAASACSNDSWDSWLSFNKFLSAVRPKSSISYADHLGEMTDISEQDEVKKGCDCVKTHCCLQVVDSDEDLTEDIVYDKEALAKDLLIGQLCSVETGSEGDLLTRVNSTNPLLKSKNAINSGEVDNIAKTQDTDKIPLSEDSSEDLAKKFYIEQWLNHTKP